MARPKPAKEPVPSPGISSDWKARAALFALTLLAYVNSFSSGLVQDARALLTLDDRLRAVTVDNLRLIFDKTYWWPKVADGLYRPVTTLSLLVNYAILGNGQSPTGYHVVNFLLHAANVWLVYSLARRLFKSALPAFLASALWAVHPIGTEAVTNIAGRADLLAALSVLGGLLLYARLDEFPGWRNRAAIAGLFAIAVAGVFAKENAAVLIGLMLLWDLCQSRRPRVIPYAAVASSLVILWAVRYAVLGALPAPQAVFVDNPLRTSAFLVARWTALKVIALDLGLLVWPAGLSCDRSYNQIPLAGFGDPVAWIGLIAIIALLAVAAIRFRRDPILFFAVGFFGIALLPTSNLIVSIGSVMAERFLYLPSIGFALAVAALAFRLKNQKTATILLAAAILLCAGRTLARNVAWQDNLSLASSDVVTSPGSFKLHEMLAKSLYDQDPNANLDRAIAEEERAWAILEPLPPALSTQLTPEFLGIYYRSKGDALGGVRSPQGRIWYEKSRAILLRAREISRVAETTFDDAQRAAGKPLSARGVSQDLYLNLVAADLPLGEYNEALDAAGYARGIDPRRPESYDAMALALFQMGHPEDAAVALAQKALVDGFAISTLNDLARIYRNLPGGDCAFDTQGHPNRSCALMARDLCRASTDLQSARREARMPSDPALTQYCQ